MKRTTTLTAAAVLGLSLGLTLPAAAMAEVKIGLLTTLTGPGSVLGQDQLDGFMLAVEQGGGKLGGVPVQVIKEDDQFKPEVGVQAARKLVQSDKVPIITGVVYSNVMLAVVRPVTTAGVFLVGSNAGPTNLAGKDCSPYFFSTSWNNTQRHEGSGEMANQMGFKKVYLLAPNYQAGKDAMAGFKRFYKGEVANEVFTQVNQPDYSVELAALADAKPDAAYVFFPGGMGVNFIKQYRQAGLFGKIPLLSVDTIDGATLPALQQDALGAVTNVPYSPDLDNAANKAFATAFRQKYGREPSSYAAQSFDAAQLIGSALKKTGGKVDDKDALRKALEAADFASVRGEFRYQPNHFPVAGFFRADVQAGADGKVAFVNKGPIFADLSKVSDQYAAQCVMK
jgi:branched-chain amino acid transport system substrate-binding protein